MAVKLSLTEALQAIELQLKNVTSINDPNNYSLLTGAMNWLFNPANPRAIQTEMLRSSMDSEYRDVQIRYMPKKGRTDVVTSDASASCTKTDTRRKRIQTLSPTLFVEDKFSIEEEIIVEGDPDKLQKRLGDEIRDAMRNAREDMDRQLFAAYAARFGANPSSGTGVGQYADLELLLSDSTVGAANFDVIKNEQEDNFMTGTAGIIGLGNARRYMNRLSVGNVNDGGFDVREIAAEFGMVLFKDQQTTTVLGDANRVIVSYPGLSAFFNYNLFHGDFNLNTPDSSIRTTMSDPIFPFKWDFILKYDDECSTGNGLRGAWTGRILTYFDLWLPEDESFGEPYGDLVDFNGVVGYRITEAT